MPQLQTGNDSSQSNTTTSITAYYDIATDDSSFAESECESDVDTDDNLLEISAEKRTESIWLFSKKNHDFDEEIMTVENVNQLKNMEESMIDRTSKGHYR